VPSQKGAIVSVFNVFATLVMPVVGVLAIGVAVVASTMVLRSERGARTVGHWADRLANPLTRRLRHGRTVDLTGRILDFRSGVVDVMQTRWLQVTLSTLLLQLTSWAVLVLALRGLEGGTGAVTVTWTEALAAFLFARVASCIPVTPGGLGTVDAALASLLTGLAGIGLRCGLPLSRPR
jgi:uncharacterized membrane protein YbhN (UPF0104 family)